MASARGSARGRCARSRRPRASSRVIRYAFEYARAHGRKRVTLVHKANILKMSNGLFLDTGKDVAKRYTDIAFDDMIVDATAMKLVTRPEQFDIIVTMNLFGDILSDLTAGLIGGLGVAPAAHIGAANCAMFEAGDSPPPHPSDTGTAHTAP